MQDDAHIFCLPDQITNEIIGVLDMVEQMMGSFGFHRLEVRRLSDLVATHRCCTCFMCSKVLQQSFIHSSRQLDHHSMSNFQRKLQLAVQAPELYMAAACCWTASAACAFTNGKLVLRLLSSAGSKSHRYSDIHLIEAI